MWGLNSQSQDQESLAPQTEPARHPVLFIFHPEKSDSICEYALGNYEHRRAHRFTHTGTHTCTHTRDAYNNLILLM